MSEAEVRALLAESELTRLREAIPLIEQQIREASMMGKRKHLIAIANRLALLTQEGH